MAVGGSAGDGMRLRMAGLGVARLGVVCLRVAVLDVLLLGLVGRGMRGSGQQQHRNERGNTGQSLDWHEEVTPTTLLGDAGWRADDVTKG